MSPTTQALNSIGDALIHRLPNEILVSIFLLGTRISDSYTYESQHLPLLVLVSAVCSRWRRLAITSPDLWTSINISSFATLHTAELFLERSRPCPFDLTLNSLDSKAEHELAVSITAPHVPRMRSLVLEYINVDEFCMIANAYSAHSASSLQSLKIWMVPGHDWRCAADSYPHTPLLKDANSLHSLVLNRVCSRLSPPLVGLSHLEICYFSPTYTELRDLFIACPSLSKLCLPMFLPVEHIGETDGLPLIDAKSLRALSVGLGLHTDLQCNCLLSLLAMDNLEHLEIIGELGHHFSIATHFTSRRNVLENVQRLRLHSVGYISPRDVAFFASLTSVTHLELIDMVRGDQILGRGTGTGQDDKTSGGPFGFPRLSTILLSSQMADEDDFSLLVDSLCPRGSAGILNQLIIPLIQVVSEDHFSQLKAAGIEVLHLKDGDQCSAGLAEYYPDLEEVEQDDEWDEPGDHMDYTDYELGFSDEEFFGDEAFGYDDYESSQEEIF